MNTVSTGPTVGQGSDAPDAHTRATVIPDEAPPPRLNFADPGAVRAWLDDLAAHVDDLAARRGRIRRRRRTSARSDRAKARRSSATPASSRVHRVRARRAPGGRG